VNEAGVAQSGAQEVLSANLRELYQELILDHGRRPRNFHLMEPCDASAEGYNPLCGDKCKVYLKISDDVITDVSFTGNGCAISTASASMMTQLAVGKSVADAEEMFQAFHALVTGGQMPENSPMDFEKLTVFGGVKEFPSRVKCASLPWHTLKAAIAHADQAVTTE